MASVRNGPCDVTFQEWATLPSETEAASPSTDNDTDIALYPMLVRSMFHTTSQLCCSRQYVDSDKKLEAVIWSSYVIYMQNTATLAFNGYHGPLYILHTYSLQIDLRSCFISCSSLSI